MEVDEVEDRRPAIERRGAAARSPLTRKSTPRKPPPPLLSREQSGRCSRPGAPPSRDDGVDPAVAVADLAAASPAGRYGREADGVGVGGGQRVGVAGGERAEVAGVGGGGGGSGVGWE